ncbi:succinate--CoA ligase [GDP-forming] subunit beta, mitochondrial-like [Watersipora subatra]|uniref:succinate--CoA ligase [GDP-forming] subunit beta, mitochondrial-like n=1 Tax=Watersipora subatra TaxID=2589382 RepID=UPI00355C8E6A
MAHIRTVQRALQQTIFHSHSCMAAMSGMSRRSLHLQEYQSKQLLADHGVTVQRFRVASSVKEADELTKELYEESKAEEFVIKAQILAGGKGKGHFDTGFKGGVHLTKDQRKVSELVGEMLGNRLITKQTPADGVTVNKVSIGEALDIARETYFAILMDREHNGPVLVGSPEGGVDIEQVAKENPDAIFTEAVDIFEGLTDEQAERMATNLGFQGETHKQAVEQMKNMYKFFLSVDATQIEINPFGETPQGHVVCFDAKINFDDNAYFRQQSIFAMDDRSEMDPREVEAEANNLNYVGLDGSIGCLVNGAGLAMATMDIVKLCGGEPANFLDCGGGVNEEQVHKAFTLLLHDSHVKAVLVNIFGGIVNCATVANGIVKAAKALQLTLPLVVRLEGFNVEEAQKILAESNLPILMADGFQHAAKTVVEKAGA